MKRSLTPKAKPNKPIVFLSEERVDIGVDTHKKTYDATLWSETRQSVVSRWVQPSSPQTLIARLLPYKDHIRRIVYEAGPTGYALVRALRCAGFRADVIAPSRTPRNCGPQAKSDRIDSGKLGMWSAKGLLRPVRVPTEEQEGDRQIFRLRADLVSKRCAIKQQIKSFLLLHGIAEAQDFEHWSKKNVHTLSRLALSPQLRFALDMLLADLARHDDQVRKANAALNALASLPRHCATVAALRTVPGVGPVTAMAVRTELIDPERFKNSRQVAAMAGLAPLVQSSGQSRREGPLMKSGNARLRAVLTEAAWRWVARDPAARQKFTHLIHNTGEKKKALSAMARRLLVILWHISVSGEAYRPPSPPALEKKSQSGLPDEKKRGNGASSVVRKRPSSVQPPQ